MSAESSQPMRIRGREERSAVRGGDFAGAAIEVEPALVKMADLDRIEAIDLPEEPIADGSAEEKERMRRKAEKRIAAARPELAQIGKSAQIFDFVRRDIEEDDVGTFQPHLRRLKEKNAHGGGIGEDLWPVEHFLVQGDGERSETEIARSFEQLMRSVIEMILGIVESVDVEIDLDPIVLLLVIVIDSPFLHRPSLNAGFTPRL
jgi:hypothetical protein